MKHFSLTSAIAASCLFAGSVLGADLDPIVIKGSKFFFKSNGTQFFIKGVAYQQDYAGNGTTASTGSTGSTVSTGSTGSTGGTGSTDSTGSSSSISARDVNDYTDPLADEASCKRDIPYLQQLQTNTIRVYALNPQSNHDACMKALADAGIYVIADLSAPVTDQSINRDSPAWNDALYSRYTAVVDSMAKYTNTLGFFGGNEVSNAPNNTDASAFVKAAVRDTKAYIKSKKYRPMGVGYATNDDASIRVDMANFFDCGDAASAIDFWGYNIYSWCGDSSYTKSGYDVRTKEFSKYNVPVFFAEYGCNQVTPRQFTDVGTLFGDKMSGIWSGGIVYMYFQEANNYGLVSVSGNDVKTLDDFDNLKKQIASVSPSAVQMDSYQPTNSAAACPTQGQSWNAKASPLPPSPNTDLCSCMFNSLSCIVSPQVAPKDYGDLFGTVCGLGKNVCAGLAHNASTGTYGAYSMCNSTEQLAFALDSYYKSQNKNPNACDFKGQAMTQQSVKPAGLCDALMKEAGSGGTGTISSGNMAGATSKAAAGINPIPATISTGLLPMALILTASLVSGAGMILL